MVNADSEWVNKTNAQLHIEAGGVRQTKKLSAPNGLDIHSPVEPIPDNDWTGETWGLFWPDQEMEEKSEDPTKYIKVTKFDSVAIEYQLFSRNTMKVSLPTINQLIAKPR